MPYTMPTPGMLSRRKPLMPPTQKSWREELQAANEQYRELLSDAARLNRLADEADAKATMHRQQADHFDKMDNHRLCVYAWDDCFMERDRSIELRGHAILRREQAAEVAKPWTIVKRDGAIFLR